MQHETCNSLCKTNGNEIGMIRETHTDTEYFEKMIILLYMYFNRSHNMFQLSNKLWLRYRYMSMSKLPYYHSSVVTKKRFCEIAKIPIRKSAMGNVYCMAIIVAPMTVVAKYASNLTPRTCFDNVSKTVFMYIILQDRSCIFDRNPCISLNFGSQNIKFTNHNELAII